MHTKLHWMCQKVIPVLDNCEVMLICEIGGRFFMSFANNPTALTSSDKPPCTVGKRYSETQHSSVVGGPRR
jgi:hypothetical protein